MSTKIKANNTYNTNDNGCPIYEHAERNIDTVINQDFEPIEAEAVNALFGINDKLLDEDIVSIASDLSNHLIKCPFCGESYYTELYSMTTAVYYPPVYKNGVNINPDQNEMTTYCRCLNCNKEFSFTRE